MGVLTTKGSRFLILATDDATSDYCLWWKSNRSGYTKDFDRAGRYTREEYEEAVPVGQRETHIPIEEEVAERAAKHGPRLVRFDDLGVG